ncbi:hypothetical protein DVH24_012114 [Malus domestica]|uniref:RNase H type-1 domain-containing protein n=1 Tax=Malus domestica TaxID=3750 RepID=A0A498HNW8_MALDO|nr:hypothetical protein DVH24_012114 [Malus domestica]
MWRQWPLHYPIQNFILESVSLNIMATPQDSSNDLFEIWLVIQDSNEHLASIIEVSFTHVRGQANGFVHHLARFALLSGSNCNLFEEPPDLISDLLYEEPLV